ASPFLIYY
nr:zona pellucida-binding protein, AWN-1=T3 fragment [swine, sperm, Peptide Partial, 8 aa] [Sus scrofa]